MTKDQRATLGRWALKVIKALWGLRVKWDLLVLQVREVKLVLLAQRVRKERLEKWGRRVCRGLQVREDCKALKGSVVLKVQQGLLVQPELGVMKALLA